jgi:pimeloyl-ACP methyl ester carboxylesterase
MTCKNHAVAKALLDGIRDGRLKRPDGRVVAWSEFGDPDGFPLLRVPGTPGCRYSLRADRTPWRDRNLWVITTERPGFGASTRLPGRGFAAPADDLAAIVEWLGIERVHVIGGSGSAPHQLAFAARHPDRVRAMTVLVGAAPIEAAEVDLLIGLNAEGHRLAIAGDADGLLALLSTVRGTILADPVATVRDIMEQAPEADHSVMSDPAWQSQFALASREALAQGAEGWADEALALIRPWDDIDLGAVRTSVTWWHALGDANSPLPAAERLVAQLPDARMVHFGEDEGHLAAYRREAESLDELLPRG